MINEYGILIVRAEQIVGDEQLGTKSKFWFDLNGQRWLFKEPRPNTGEDWAEKLVCEIGKVVGFEVAQVELAEFGGKKGSASLSFLDRKLREILLHGNEVLSALGFYGRAAKKYREPQHTLANVTKAVTLLTGDKAELSRAVLQKLAGYLVLDALVGNTDRHSENWGFVLMLETKPKPGDSRVQLRVAPSFDHASSLGRELTDSGRRARIAEISRYVRNGKGAVYLTWTEPQGPNPLEVVQQGLHQFPDYFGPPIQRVAATAMKQIVGTIDPMPSERMSLTARQFAKTYLAYTHEALCQLVT